MLYENERREICYIVKTMFDRNMTNAAGGNVSMRMDDGRVIMTPTMMSEEHHCLLKPENILVMDMDGNRIEGEGTITRELNMHLGILRVAPDAKIVIHAHPQNALVYACYGLSLKSITEATDRFGEIKTLKFANACSKELAAVVSDYFESRRDEIKVHAVAALLNRHGIIIADKAMRSAYSALERIETCARVNLLGRLLEL